MKVSDAIYGHVERYVSRGRLQAMLDREFAPDVERLGQFDPPSIMPDPPFHYA
jgi:hypothetical protein